MSTTSANHNGRSEGSVNLRTAPPTHPEGHVSYQTQGISFHRAEKRDAKLRMAIAGPGGSGKTYTMLEIATALGGPIAAVDTEAQSMEKYADLFEFDVLPLTSYNPEQIPNIIAAAARQGYKVLIIDVLSHFWMGKDGTREQVDKAKIRLKDNSWAAWSVVDPMYDRMIQAILTAPLHVLIGLRVKTEWLVVDGKPKRIGLKPEMRDGFEHVVDVLGDIDSEHNMSISKSRCPALADQVYNKPGRDVAVILKGWLAVTKTTPEQKAVVRARLEEFAIPTPQAVAPTPRPEPDGPVATPPAPIAPAAPQRKPLTTAAERTKVFGDLREQLGETRYFEELEAAGVLNVEAFKSHKAVLGFHARLQAIALKEVA